MAASNQKLAPARKHRTLAVREMATKFFTGDDSGPANPYNMLELAYKIHVTQLSPSRPRVAIRASRNEHRAVGAKLETATNHVLKRIEFGQTVRQLVSEAMFSTGVLLKVGMQSEGLPDRLRNGSLWDIPYASVVDIDHMVLDMEQSSIEEITYIGNTGMRVPMGFLEQVEEYDQSVVRQMAEEERYTVTADGTQATSDMLGRPAHQDFVKIAHIAEIYLPLTNQMVVLAHSGSHGRFMNKPLAVYDWEGPPGGPFTLLAFNQLPGHVMGYAPSMTWVALNEMINRLIVKLWHQGRNQKNILAVMGGGQSDANKVTQARDGEAISLTGGGAVEERAFRGVDGQSMAFLMTLVNHAKWQWGNLDALGGLSPQARTLGQDELLHASASQRIVDMQRQVERAIRKGMEKVAWYMWHDPAIHLEFARRVEGAPSVEINSEWVGGMPHGQFFEHEIDIAPFSQTTATPQSRANTLMQILQSVVLPILPQLQQQGKSLDFEAMFKTLGRDLDLPELESMIIGMINPEDMPGEPPHKSPVTRRTYDRVNRPAASQSGKDAVLAQAFAGSKSQQSERDSLSRPTV